MTPERFREIEGLYHAAREATADQRQAMLAQADPALRREVESLLVRDGGGRVDLPTILNTAHAPENLTELASGAQLGPYRIDGKLGEGGMGEVFRAVDTRLGRAVAIKTVRAQFSNRFEREARLISSLNHPNICTLFDIGSNYLVMELVEGETLAARLKSGPLPIETALLYASQMAAAMVEAHGKGVVHRDLKPGNIMIAKTGIKVLDFGLARSEHDETVTASHMIVGTPAYMAPEQRQGKPADARTDIYAFGCILYEMLTGDKAARGRRRIRTRKLETLVSRSLEEDPGRRWQSAEELQRELTVAPRASRGSKEAPKSSLPRGPKSTLKYRVLLGEFENRTGESEFDGTLRYSLSMELEQSSVLTLVSDQQVSQMLRFMNRAPETRLTPEIAHEICERAGGTAVIDGSIASLGSRYVLLLRARNLAGDTLSQGQAQAGTKEEVLSVLSKLADQTRKRLGESLAASREDSTLLEQATTPSLEALKAFTAARRAMFTRGMASAIPLLQRALAIDPDFAMAHADLGFFHWNVGQTEMGAEHVRKAYESRERVSERERFFILFLYDRQVTGNLQKLLETLESWAQTYPSDFYPSGLLGGWGTQGTGQYQRGLDASEHAIQLNPDAMPAYAGVFIHNLCLGRFQEAAAGVNRAADRKLDVAHFMIARYHLAFLAGDEAGMKREIDYAHGKLEAENWMSHNEALVLAYSGQMRNARIRWRHTVQMSHQAGESEKAAIFQAAESVCEAHFGNWNRATELARAALDLEKGRDVVYAAAFALALSGEIPESRRLAEDLAKRFPEDTPAQFEYLPTLRALFALHDTSPLEAIDRLQTSLPYDLAMPGTAFFAKFGGLYPAYVRGLAYLDAGRGAEAAAEFQKVLDNRGIVLADPIGALAHLQLGRALVLSGEKQRARSAYETFFNVWKNADADIPIFHQSRSEYDQISGPN
jgi:serine/threonine protein kinase/tetratricopeptide (TPR) repeat protein